MRLWILGLLLLAAFFGQVSAQTSCFYADNVCDNGYQCYHDSDECDGYEDCDDGSDEEGCVDVTGIIIGVTLAGFFLFVVLPIIICVVIFCCVVYAAGSTTRHPVTTVVSAAPNAPYTTVVATGSATQQTAMAYPAQGIKQGDYPPPYYPQEMTAYPAYPPPVSYPPPQY